MKLRLTDMFGTVQLVFDLSQTTDKDGELIKALNLETVIAVNGIVRERPEEMKNKSMKSGDIEVLVDKWHMLNPSATPPYDIRADKLVLHQYHTILTLQRLTKS